MILAIRALRATIFAFNASIWVSKAALEAALASATDEAADKADPAVLPDVAIAVKAPATDGANTDCTPAEDVDDLVPPT